MKVEVLVSAMNQQDFSLVDKLNIHTDAVIINQTDKNRQEIKEFEFGTVKLLSVCERGLSKSRNCALNNASGDICILCDDDVRYVQDYDKVIEKAFLSLPDADVIVFNIESTNSKYNTQRKITEISRIPTHKAYGSVRIAFRRKRIIEAGISFNENFGTGSGVYSMAEDSLFFREVHKRKLKAYTYPETIASVDFSTSTWFSGYTEKYFYDIGAFLSAAYPNSKYLMMFYYPVRLRKMSKLSVFKELSWMTKGIKGYNKMMSYDKFVQRRRSND